MIFLALFALPSSLFSHSCFQLNININLVLNAKTNICTISLRFKWRQSKWKIICIKTKSNSGLSNTSTFQEAVCEAKFLSSSTYSFNKMTLNFESQLSPNLQDTSVIMITYVQIFKSFSKIRSFYVLNFLKIVLLIEASLHNGNLQ